MDAEQKLGHIKTVSEAIGAIKAIGNSMPKEVYNYASTLMAVAIELEQHRNNLEINYFNNNEGNS